MVSGATVSTVQVRTASRGVGVAGGVGGADAEAVLALRQAGERARGGAGLPGAARRACTRTSRRPPRRSRSSRPRTRSGRWGRSRSRCRARSCRAASSCVVPESVKRAPGLGQELPLVAAGVKRELEDAERPGVLHLRVGQRRVQRVVLRAPLADHELAHAALVVHLPVGRLGREALVGVVVAAVDELGAVLVEQLPERGRLRERAVGGPGAPARVVPVGAHAASGVGGEVLLEPLVLLGAGAAAADQLAVAVQHHEVPAAEVVAVPALAALPGRGSEVGEVARGAGRAVLVVAHRRLGAPLVAAPGRVVAALELAGLAVVLLRVAGDADHPGRGVEEPRGGLVAVGPARGDVAEAEQHRVALYLGERGHRRRARLADREAVHVEDLARRPGHGLEDEGVDVAAGLLARVGERRQRLPRPVRGHALLPGADERVGALALLVLA